MKLKTAFITSSLLFAAGPSLAYDCKDAFQITRTELTYLEFEIDDCLAKGGDCYWLESSRKKFKTLGTIITSCGIENDRGGRTTIRMADRINRKMKKLGTGHAKNTSAPKRKAKKRVVSNRRPTNKVDKTLTTSKVDKTLTTSR